MTTAICGTHCRSVKTLIIIIYCLVIYSNYVNVRLLGNHIDNKLVAIHRQCIIGAIPPMPLRLWIATNMYMTVILVCAWGDSGQTH